VEEPIEQIKSLIDENKKNELTLYKTQIKLSLEEDIISRYYLERGSIEVSFKNDVNIKKATEILTNTSQYKKMLNIH
jgi:carboxyl-terminal processing protease